jgi:hypothetical protein
LWGCVALQNTNSQLVAVFDHDGGIVVEIKQRRRIGAFGGKQNALASGMKSRKTRDVIPDNVKKSRATHSSENSQVQ